MASRVQLRTATLFLVIVVTFMGQGESAPQSFMSVGRDVDVWFKQAGDAVAETGQNVVRTINGMVVTESPSEKLFNDISKISEDPNFTIDKNDDLNTLSEKWKYFVDMYPDAFPFMVMGLISLILISICCCCCCCKPRGKPVVVTVQSQRRKTPQEAVPMSFRSSRGAGNYSLIA